METVLHFMFSLSCEIQNSQHDITIPPPKKKMIKNYKTPTFYIAMLCIILQTIDMYIYTHQLDRKL